MRLKRPIAFILSAAVAASALTGCDSFSGHAAAAANSAQVQQLIEFIADLGLERDLRQALQKGGDLRQALLTLLGLESAVNFNVDDLAGARPGQHAVQVWEVTAQSAEDAAALAASQIRAVLEQLKSSGVTEGRIGMVEVDGKYYVVVDVEVTEENTFEPIRPASDDDDDSDDNGGEEEQQPQEAEATLESDKLTITGGSGTLDASTLSELLESEDSNWKNTVTTVDLSQSGYTQIGNPDDSYNSGAFAGCKNLVSVTLPSTVTAIGSYAFYNCSGLETVLLPANLTTIGNNAFDSCENLTTVTLPSSVTTIGNFAFRGCNSLTSINLSACKNLATIGNYAFSNTSLASIDLSGCTSLATIDIGAFYNCTSLKKVTLPSTVTAIGSYAFYDCSGLETVLLPANLTTIETNAFAFCEKLTSIDLRNTQVKTIGNGAFAECTNLGTVLLPESLNKIDVQIFYNCNSLKNIYFQSVPAQINPAAFDNLNAENITVYYNSSTCDLTMLQNAIKGSGMKDVDLNNNNIPAFVSDPNLTTFTYLLGL